MNKLCGTRSTGCKGKAGKEGGSKQGQTGTDEKTKGRSRGGWGWADGAENGEERRKCGEHREHRERGEQAVEAEKTGNVYRKCTIQKKKTAESLPQSFVFCSPSSGAASGILPYSAGCSAGVSAGACAGISAWGIVAGASVSRTRS